MARAKRSLFSHLVFMGLAIAHGRALIDHCRGISVEMTIGANISRVTDLVYSLIQPTTFTFLEMYEVFELVYDDLVFENFVEHNGWYPILAGETDYNFTC